MPDALDSCVVLALTAPQFVGGVVSAKAAGDKTVVLVPGTPNPSPNPIDPTGGVFGGPCLYFGGFVGGSRNFIYSTSTHDSVFASSVAHLDTSDFAVEVWVKTSRPDSVLLDTGTTGNLWQLKINAAGRLEWWTPTAANRLTGTSVITNNVYHHCVVERIGETYYLYVDGVLEATKTVSVLHNASSTFAIGVQYDVAAYDFVGWLDNIWITRGAHRYGGPFTPPTSARDLPRKATGLPVVAPTRISTGELPLTAMRSPDTIRSLDLYWLGKGIITDTVEKKGTPNLPLRRLVRLFEESSGQVVADTWSDATTGVYAFPNIDPTRKYMVVAFDHERNYRAVIADNITPSLMP